MKGELCSICKRVLGSDSDPLSEDCGGDCIHCQIRHEADCGDYITAALLAESLVERLNSMGIEEAYDPFC